MSSIEFSSSQVTRPEIRDLAHLLRRRSSNAARRASALMARSRKKVAIVASPDSEALIFASLSHAEFLYSPPGEVTQFDTIVADLSHAQSGMWATFLSRAALAGCDIRHVAEYLEACAGRVSLEHFSADHLGADQGRLYRLTKRVFDVAVTTALLPAAAVLISAASVAILLKMGRPIFYTQARVGQNGKVFRIFKLRTMRPALPGAPVCATAINDPRITLLGAFLRRFRIDELPQLWNVLRGDMSLIGPRPEQPALVAQYNRELKGFAHRHRLRPGITGWAQVMGGYACSTAESRDKLSFDLFYVKYASLMLDLEIAVRTIRTIISGNSAR